MRFRDLVFACAFGAVASTFLTAWMLAYARRRLLDLPNERSSHRVATPRGGGAAFISVFGVVTWVMAAWAGETALWRLLVLPTLMVAAIGFIDDHVSLDASIRLAVHLAAAIWVVVLGQFEHVTIFGLVLHEPVAAIVAAGLIAWLLNLFNFMDGINGLACAEAIFVASAGAVLEWNAGNVMGGAFLAILCASVAGFVPWNFPKAKIFMGDVGSGALGFVFGSFLLLAWIRSETHFLAWLILLAAFVGDASWTLMIRLLRREQIFQPHRTHAYQRAAEKWGHLRVTFAFSLVNCLCLLPLASAAIHWPESGRSCALAAYLVVFSCVIWQRAGTSQQALRRS